MIQGKKEEVQKKLLRAARLNRRKIPQNLLDKVCSHSQQFSRRMKKKADCMPFLTYYKFIFLLLFCLVGNRSNRQERERAGHLYHTLFKKSYTYNGIYLVGLFVWKKREKKQNLLMVTDSSLISQHCWATLGIIECFNLKCATQDPLTVSSNVMPGFHQVCSIMD